MILAEGILGRRPSPPQVAARLKATARKLGSSADAGDYGAGLLNAGAATAQR
jgi:serine protease